MNSEKYLENRLPKNDKRFASFVFALDLLQKRNATILVETGTARFGTQNFGGDGGSTVLFADWASKNGAFLYSVDIDPQSVKNAKNATIAYKKYRKVVCSDSIAFLKNFNQPIDFLYLDSYDFELNNPNPSQQHHLREIEAAYPFLHADSIIMLDDCDLPHGGKCPLVIDYLRKRGWKVIFKGYQVILSR